MMYAATCGRSAHGLVDAPHLAPAHLPSPRARRGFFCALNAAYAGNVKVRTMLDLTAEQMAGLLIALASISMFAVTWYVCRRD
jgi:hypothetical protein